MWKLILTIFCIFHVVRCNLLRKQQLFTESDNDVLVASWKKVESNMKGAVEGILSTALPRIVRATAEMDLSEECYTSITKYVYGIKKLKSWAIKFLDSTGKPISGYLTGTVSSLGSYDECLDIQVPGSDPSKVDFTGQYCLLDFRFLMPPKPRFYNMVDFIPGLENITFEAEALNEIRKNAFINYFMAFRFGICIPSTCTIDDVKSMTEFAGNLAGLKGHVPHCEVREHFNPDQTQSGIMIALGIYICIVVILTLIDITPDFWTLGRSETSFKNLGVVRSVARAFSLNANTVRLASTDSPEPSTDCLNGIKFFSIGWVILGHCYLLINWQIVANNEISKAEIRKPIFQVVMNALVSVDTFFTVTAFLMAALSIRFVDKVGKKAFNIPLFFISRIFRLLPAIVLTTGMTFLFPLVGDGPVWHETVDILYENCQENWWYNFLFVGNVLNPRDSCLPHFWYSMADMQMVILAVIFLLLVFKNPRLGVCFGVALVVFSCVISGAMAYIRELQPTMLLITPDPDVVIETWRNFHFMTYVHIAPYAIGLLLGYIFARHPNLNINKLVQVTFWLVSIASALLVVYGTSWWNDGKPWELVETLVYAGFHRTAWSLSMGWLIFACCTGRGGFMNRILSWKGFFPAARLTYSVYMVHCLVIWFYVGTSRNTKEGQIEATWLIISNTFISFALAFPCHLFVEAPMNQLFKYTVMRLFASKKDQNVENDGSVTNQISAETCAEKTECFEKNDVESGKERYISRL